jgi:carboxyl-terminal processing protease
MKIQRTILAPLVVATVALATGGWFLQRGAEPERNVYANARLFDEVLEFVSEAFVEERSRDDLYQMAIDGLLQELGDPHTGFLPADEYENLRIQTQGEYGGLGIQIARRAGWITVINPLPGTPGERAGLRAGDQIIEVEGESTKGWTEDEAVAQLRGPKGAPVNITVARIGFDEPIDFRIVRDEIHIMSVPTAYMLDDGVGYVELQVFSESSTDEVRGAVEKLVQQGAKGLVFDLRDNTGGLLEQGVSVSDLFLERGDMVVETRGRIQNQNQKLIATHRDEFPDLPIVVLVGPRSASATEIVAGALQDHDRALLVGGTTYGKGSVQTLLRLRDNNWLKLTTAKWYTPSGRSIQRPFGDEHPVEQIAGGDVIGVGAPVETEPEERPEYRTDAGRVVFGGGGITPDLRIPPDTLVPEERVLYQALMQKNPTKFFETRFAFAVRYNEEHPQLQPGFEVTDAMLDAFYTALADAGLTVEREVYDAGRRWVAMHLGYELTISRWGAAEAKKRQNGDDSQVRTAIELLHRADSPASLFAAAEAYESTLRTAVRSSGPEDGVR